MAREHGSCIRNGKLIARALTLAAYLALAVGLTFAPASASAAGASDEEPSNARLAAGATTNAVDKPTLGLSATAIGGPVHELSATAGDMTAQASNTCGDSLTWSLSTEGALTISGTGRMYDYQHASSLPWYEAMNDIETVTIGDGVTYIGSHAFDRCTSLSGIAFGANSLLAEIGDSAFDNCTGLTSVAIPASVTTIGMNAFHNCSALTNLTFGNESQLKTIDSSAFNDCHKLTSVIIPASVTTINDNVFSETGLTSVTFENRSNLTTIGDRAFLSCDGLTSMTLPDSLSNIYGDPFESCSNLEEILVGEANESFFSDDGILFDKTKETLIRYPSGHKGSSYAIPNSVTSIESNAFYSCGLTSVEIPSSVTSIGIRAFYSCGLTSVEIPNSVTSIGLLSFAGCSKLEKATIGSGTTTINPSWMFSRCTSLANVYVDNLEESVTVQGNWPELVTVHWAHLVNAVANPQTGGSVTPDKSPSQYLENKTVTLTVAANDGYALAGVVETWTDKEGNTQTAALAKDPNHPGAYQFKMPDANTTVTASFNRVITITAASQEWTYDGKAHSNSNVTVTSGSLIGSDKLVASTTGSVTNVTDSAEGNNQVAADYKIMRDGQDVTGSYAITAAAGTLTIKPAPLTITARDQTGTYNGELQGESDTVYEDSAQIASLVEVKNLQGSDKIANVELFWQGTYAGPYPVEVQSAAVNRGKEDVTGNYVIKYMAGTFTIAPAKATITVASASKRVGEPDPTFTGKVSGIVKDGDLGEISYSRTNTAEVAGTYKGVLTATYTPNPNYAVTVKPGNFTIESDVPNTFIAKLQTKGKKSLTLSWAAVAGADGYDVFFTRCSHGGKKAKWKRAATIKAGETLKWTKKRLKKHKAYKVRVRAFAMKGGKKVYLVASPAAHIYTSGGSGAYTNAKAVKVAKPRVTLAPGQSHRVKASVVKLDRSKKLMPARHAPKLRYVSSDPTVATVNAKGKVVAKAKGSCKVYVYAVTGASKAIKITVL